MQTPGLIHETCSRIAPFYSHILTIESTLGTVECRRSIGFSRQLDFTSWDGNEEERSCYYTLPEDRNGSFRVRG